MAASFRLKHFGSQLTMMVVRTIRTIAFVIGYVSLMD